jgi:acyl carrier protein phosphodiesterase
MISDFVKGKTKYDYIENIQKGITIHRMIDRFTDDHPSTKKAKEFFRPAYRLYSGAFIDVVYDHFLANDPLIFSETSLLEFSKWVYDSLDEYKEILPANFAAMFSYMKEQNWLYNYRTILGTERSFGGLVRRARYMNESKTAAILFEKNYASLRDLYTGFFPDLERFARELLAISY